MTEASNSRFNAEAAAWDKNVDVLNATNHAVTALLARFPNYQRVKDAGRVQEEGPDILEIGCGTGLLSLRMAPYSRTLLAIDAASGMIDALKVKLSDSRTAPSNVRPLCLMLEDPEDPHLPLADPSDPSKGRFKADLILSHLVLHHIPQLEPLLATVFGCLKPGGQIALTDFEDFGPEARKFHPEAKMFGVERDGIKREWFEGLIKDAGFVEVEVKTGWKMMKEVERFPGEWGQKKPEGKLDELEFPFLLCCGRKPS